MFQVGLLFWLQISSPRRHSKEIRRKNRSYFYRVINELSRYNLRESSPEQFVVISYRFCCRRRLS